MYYVAFCHVCLCILRGIVQCEEKLTISASWSKDEDISRLLQSLPNWANMAQPRQTRQKREDEEDFTRYARRYIQNTFTMVYANSFINSYILYVHVFADLLVSVVLQQVG